MRKLMYIEYKGGELQGPARIGWVTFSKSMRSLKYQGKTLKRVGSGYKYNCVDAETGEEYWVSGPKRGGGDTLYGGVVHIDEDAREEYWLNVRKLPGMVHRKTYRG